MADPEALVAEAESLAEDDPARAAELARQALEGDPYSARAANILGALAFGTGRYVEAQMMFELACSLPGVDEDMVDNLATVRRRLGALYVAAANEPEPAPRDPYGYDEHTRRLSAELAGPASREIVDRLAEIPSATERGERNLIRAVAAKLWNGQDNVFENGPLLGGTTRALAMGMLANPNRDPAARLHTYDWFDATIGLDVPPESFDVLIGRGLLTPEVRDEMERVGSFKPVFDHVHRQGQDYSDFVVSHTGALPGSPADEQTWTNLFVPEPDTAWRLLLVDGCKSWYGTRYFYERVCEHIPVGSHIMFQDYGWYTCFWLSSLIGFFPDRYRLVANADATFCFEIVAPISADELLARFPPAPQDVGADGFDSLYGEVIARAAPLGDHQLNVALAIHHAAAIAYVGERERAKSMLQALQQHPKAAAFPHFVKSALRAPTYTPDGPILLDG
jgi:hypothetical protein